MTGSSVWATLTINGAFCVLFMSLFEYYRTRLPDLYAPRSRGSNPKYRAPRPGWFEWVQQVHDISDDEMFRIAGMDGYVFVRFVLFCAKLCTLCGILAALILIPVYATSPSDALNGLEIASMANLDPNGNRLWAAFVFIYVFTFLFLYLIHKEYENFVSMRKRFFHSDVDLIPLQTRYTVQVENIPSELRSGDKLFQVFDTLFPGDILHAHIALSTPELDQLVAERDAVRAQLEKVIARYEGGGKRSRPLLNRVKSDQRIGGKEVDSISYLSKRLRKLCDRVARLQRAIHESGEEQMVESPRSPRSPDRRPFFGKIHGDLEQAFAAVAGPGGGEDGRESPPQPSLDSDSGDEESDPGSPPGIEMGIYNPLQKPAVPLRRFSEILEEVRSGINALFISTTGFVTFKTRKAQLTAVKTSILLEQYPLMTVVAAPPPGDVIWANISASKQATEQAMVFSAGAYYGCLAVWGGVMAFVAAISTMSTLETYLPFLRNFNTIAYAVVEGILPVVVVIAFAALVSGAIAFIARNIEKRKSNTAVEVEVFKWYFMYQIANIYLILAAGSVWDSIVAAVEHPAAIVTYLSAAVPRVSTFFVNYIITVWLSGVPYKLIRRLRALEYLVFWSTHTARYTTRRMMKEGPYREIHMGYGTELSDVLYVLCIVLLYWVISPVVLLFAVPLFWSWYYAWKYEFAFVVTRAYESGGEMWYLMYQYAMMGLLAGTAMFMAYMGLQQGVAQSPMLVPLPVIILMAWRYTEQMFRQQSLSMPFDLAIRDDLKQHGLSSGSFEENKDASGETPQQTPPKPNYALFSADFMKQPNLVCAADIFPYPYRIDGVPLFNRHGALNEVYVDDLPEGEHREGYTTRLAAIGDSGPGDEESKRNHSGGLAVPASDDMLI